MPAESRLYEPTKRALEKILHGSKDVHFEITANSNPSDKIKKLLDDLSLYIINVENFKPDIIGYRIPPIPVPVVKAREEIIIAEVKSDGPKIHDIYQTKTYADIFRATHALLISPENPSEELKRFLKKRPDILSYPASRNPVRIGLLDKTGINEKSWFPSKPF